MDNPDVEILARGDGPGGGAARGGGDGVPNSGGANNGSQLKGTIVDIEPSRIGMAWAASAATKTADGSATLGLCLLSLSNLSVFCTGPLRIAWFASAAMETAAGGAFSGF